MVQHRFHQLVATAYACATLCCLLSLAGCQSRNSDPAPPPPSPKEDAPKEDQEAIQGAWVVVSAEENGVPIKGIKGERHTFTAEEYTVVKEKKEEVVSATYKLDPVKSPKEILICVKVGLQGFGTVDTFAKGIYQLDKDELKICWGSRGGEGPAPTEFATRVGSGNKLLVFKREKS